MQSSIREKADHEWTEEDQQGEAIYHSILGELDALSPEQRISVVHNWVRYVMLSTATGMSDSTTVTYADLMKHCYNFALVVMEIPQRLHERQTGHSVEPCGKCATCILNGDKPPEEKVVQ